MGGRSTEAIHLAIASLASQDLELAQKVVDGDDVIDRMNKEIEDECIRLIATQQPIAKDLRIVTTVLKTTTDLERIADHATNIAEITLRIGRKPLIKQLVDIPAMAKTVEERVHSALEALINRDVEKATETCLSDELVDQQYEKLLLELMGYIGSGDDGDRLQALNLLFTARFLERVGDHATNIAERVIYLVTGNYVKY